MSFTKTLLAYWLHVVLDKLFSGRHWPAAAVTLKTSRTPSLFECCYHLDRLEVILASLFPTHLCLDNTATICARIAKQLVVVILAIWLVVTWPDKVCVIHEGLLAVVTHKVLNVPRFIEGADNASLDGATTGTAHGYFGLVVTFATQQLSHILGRPGPELTVALGASEVVTVIRIALEKIEKEGFKVSYLETKLEVCLFFLIIDITPTKLT